MGSPYYPPGADRVTRSTAEYTCRACHDTWEVRFSTELGGTFADNDDDVERCPSCGSEHVVPADDRLARVPLEEEEEEEPLCDKCGSDAHPAWECPVP